MALGLVAALWIVPYLWMTITSLKTLDEIVQAPAYPLPSHPNLDAYREVFTSLPVGRYLLNTLVMAGSIACLQILLALPAGYALAKLRFVGKRAAFGLVLTGIFAALVLPALRLARWWRGLRRERAGCQAEGQHDPGRFHGTGGGGFSVVVGALGGGPVGRV